MDLSAVKNAISIYAPLLGGAIGGQAGDLVGSLIAMAFGSSFKNPEDLLAKIRSDPEAALKLRQLQDQHQEALMALENQQAIIITTDIQDARKRQLEEEKITGHRDWIVPILAFFVLCIYAIIQFYVIFNPSSADDLVSARLQDVVIIVMSYYFGYSRHN